MINKFSFLLIIVVGLFAGEVSYAEVCISSPADAIAVRRLVDQQVGLINEILREPKFATVRAWTRLANPHDETEINFFANSISGGIASAYGESTPTGKAIIKHTKSPGAPSVVLGHLRLSVMAFANRPSDESPTFQVVSIDKATLGALPPSELVAKVLLRTHDSSPQAAGIPSAITFDVASEPSGIAPKQACLSLRSIDIGGRQVFGWWHNTVLSGDRK